MLFQINVLKTTKYSMLKTRNEPQTPYIIEITGAVNFRHSLPMSQKKKPSYLTKEIKFGSQKLVLFSLDGCTWSSRKNELLEIQERHEREKIKYSDIKGTEAEEEKDTTAKPEEDADKPFELAEVEQDESAPKASGKRGKAATSSSTKGAARKLPEQKGNKSAKTAAASSIAKRRISSKPKKSATKVKGKGRKAA